MNIALWIVQVVLFFAFMAAGVMKTFSPISELAAGMAWVKDVNPIFMVRLPGIAEIVGAIGLILPALIRIKPRLTPLAAAALAFVMVMAAILHVSRGEFDMIFPNLVLVLLSAFVAVGRWKWKRIEAK